MSRNHTRCRLATSRMPTILVTLAASFGSLLLAPARVPAQPADGQANPPAAEQATTDPAVADLQEKLQEAERMAQSAIATDAPEAPERTDLPPIVVAAPKINFLELLLRGRWLMLPIGIMSLLVVAVGVERFFGLQRRRVVPAKLTWALEELAESPDGFDPAQAYKLCQQYGSASSSVVQTMLLKVGRPHGEVENAITQASQREADRLHSNVRWLNLAAAVTPLLGLLGTVWGMIQAFFQTANLPVEANRAQVLADGIWTALVTTFAGLGVAIPAAVLAHYFEGRITNLFRELDETLFDLLPHLERYEGRLRLSKEQLEQPDAPPIAATIAAAKAARDAKRKKSAASRK
ncbi:MAG: MotA/TolQ/ExbB proton channel family protein [Planctomycetes bacterium]|nr:MotA/TolQ/ExbB proton channel family protein [Planctomycetota bacterium]